VAKITTNTIVFNSKKKNKLNQVELKHIPREENNNKIYQMI
jgi:hypothetical protein